MRKEFVEYIKDLPINIYLANIMEYPIHWHDAIEILFVLRGSIDVGIETEVYTVEEKEIEIINVNEVHSIKSKDKNNLVLIFNIDPNFFERYYDDAKEVFFYTDSSEEGAQEEEKYYILRKYLSILLWEVVGKIDDYEDMLEENLLEMMYHLLNNFHYLFYEEESLKEDEVQLERYHRIVKYISNNYMNKVSLQDLAEKEFLSSQYLSYKIKSTFGHSFNEFLNQIRVEESTKLLLDTDKNISEISEEVGFSHVRYFNKHFKLHYKCSPMQYRKKYKVGEEVLEKMKKITYYDIQDALTFLNQYLEDYERYNYDNRIIKLDIDLSKETLGIFKRPDVIDLGDISLLLEEDNRRILEEIQREIGFKYGIINNLFTEDMDIYMDREHRFINWTRVENILSFIKELDLNPIISTDNVKQYIIEDFISHFTAIFGDEVEEWINTKKEDLNVYIYNEPISKMQDTLYMVPYIMHNHIEIDNNIALNMVDEISKDTVLSNDTFFGGRGIFTSNYLKKPSYYAYMLLSLLGDEILYKGEGYIVTKREKDFQILLFNPIGVDDKIIYQGEPMEKLKEKKVSINILNMEGDYRVTKYELNKRYGSVYDKWKFLGSPERLDKEHLDLLKEFIHPNISFYYGKKSTVYNAVSTVKPNGGVLYLLKSVQNEYI